MTPVTDERKSPRTEESPNTSFKYAHDEELAVCNSNEYTYKTGR